MPPPPPHLSAKVLSSGMTERYLTCSVLSYAALEVLFLGSLMTVCRSYLLAIPTTQKRTDTNSHMYNFPWPRAH